MPDQDLVPTKAYPVISISVDAARTHCAEGRTVFSLPNDLTQVLQELSAKMARVNVRVWAREGLGMDATNQPAEMIYLFIDAGPRSTRLVSRLRTALQARWGEHSVAIEGVYAGVGDETIVFESAPVDRDADS